MRSTLLLLVVAVIASASASADTRTAFKPFEFLLGRWIAVGGPAGAISAVSHSSSIFRIT